MLTVICLVSFPAAAVVGWSHSRSPRCSPQQWSSVARRPARRELGPLGDHAPRRATWKSSAPGGHYAVPPGFQQQNLNFLPEPHPHGAYFLICMSADSLADKSRVTATKPARAAPVKAAYCCGVISCPVCVFIIIVYVLITIPYGSLSAI